MEVSELALDRIVPDPANQPREGGIDAEHVATLQENPDAWPPVVVVDQDGFQLVDGFHRYAAAQNLGLETLRSEVRDVPADGDLRALAYALNVTHGKPLTKPDRRREAERLLRTYGARISSMDVARRVGISPTSAEKYRGELVRSGAIEASDQRVSRSGVTYTPSAPRQRGELPEVQETLTERLLTAKDRREQRRLAHYCERLSVALDDQYAFTNWEHAGDAASACRAVLGDADAAELGGRLGPAARNVLDVAVALGYEDEA